MFKNIMIQLAQISIATNYYIVIINHINIIPFTSQAIYIIINVADDDDLSFLSHVEFSKNMIFVFLRYFKIIYIILTVNSFYNYFDL